MSLEEQTEELECMKKRFDLVLSADYQMSKLIPYWRSSPQPGSTYYFQKLSHDVFGIVNHANDAAMIAIFDERVGPKNSDHTLSYITHYVTQSACLPQWVRRIHLFLDNAVSTNKNRYIMSWACEMVQHGVLDFIRVSFMIPGHTKFTPDHLFAKIAKAYNRSDVFMAEDLKELASSYADTVIDSGEIVVDWRNALAKKYPKFPNICSYHDFVIMKNVTTQHVMIRQRKLCYSGSFESKNVFTAHNPEENVIPTADKSSYRVLNNVKSLSALKLNHLHQMYTKFIPSDRHPPFLSE